MKLPTICITLLIATLTLAAEPPRKVYQPVGAPADPKVPAQWNRYHDYAQATAFIQQLAKTFPNRCKLQSLGKSWQGREMWCLTITNFETGDDRAKPAMYVDGGIHANELQGPEVVLYTAWYLLEMDGRVEHITQLLKDRTFYMVPMMSPDSRDAHMYEPNTTHSPRSGQRPVDDDRDGLINEDKADDLDGDGHITQMRVADPNGKWKPHPEFPELMIPVKDGEKGSYTLLGTEGYDNDGDGRVNEDGDGNYDPNRNWPWQWQPEYVQFGAHNYPLSLNENRVVADFIAAHPNIIGGQSFHNAAGMILRGPGVKGDRFDPNDVKVFDAIGQRGEKILPAYKYGSIAELLYNAYGSEIDWLYSMRGVAALTNELWTGFNLFRTKDDGAWFGKEEDLHQFNKLLLFHDGFVPWHKVQHPQFGEIEVGGMKKTWVRQPPSFLLEEECHRNMAFTLYHADQLPLVRVQSVTAKPLGGGVTQVTAIIENTKLVPTHLAVDTAHHITPPDRVSISGRDVKVIAALTSHDPFFDDAKEHKLHPHEVRLDTIPGYSVVYVRWLVLTDAAAPLEVRLDSIKGGHDAMTVLPGAK
jgi:hypothetical protein